MREGGFTLLELLVVLSLTVVLAGMAAPRFQASYRALRFRETARQAQTLLWAARLRAIDGGEPVEVDREAGRLVARVSEEAEGPSPGAATLVDRVTLGEGIELRSDTLPIRFTPDGHASGGSLHLSSAAGTATLVVDAATGFIALQGNGSGGGRP